MTQRVTNHVQNAYADHNNTNMEANVTIYQIMHMHGEHAYTHTQVITAEYGE